MDVIERVAHHLDLIGLHLRAGGGTTVRRSALASGTRHWDVAIVETENPTGDLQTLTALQREEGMPVIAVAERIDGRTADALRAAGIAFADAHGNAWIALDGIHVDIRGRRVATASTRPSGPPEMNLFSSKRARVSFVLLAWPDLAAAPIRQLAAAAGVSIGLAQTTVAALDESGYLRRGTAALRRGEELLDAWTAAYPLGLGRTLVLGDFVGDPRFDIGVLGPDAQVSGESAVPSFVRPETATVYVRTFDRKEAFALRWRTDGTPNIHVRQKFWTPPVEGTGPRATTREVPSVLVYADLLAAQDSRLTEAAYALRASDDRLRSL